MNNQIEETAFKYKEELILAYSIRGNHSSVKLLEFSCEDIESYYLMKSNGMFYFEESFLQKICSDKISAFLDVEVFQFREDIRKKFVTAKKQEILDNVEEKYKSLLKIILMNKTMGRPRTLLKINNSVIRISDKTEVLRQSYRKITKPIRGCL